MSYAAVWGNPPKRKSPPNRPGGSRRAQKEFGEEFCDNSLEKMEEPGRSQCETPRGTSTMCREIKLKLGRPEATQEKEHADARIQAVKDAMNREKGCTLIGKVRTSFQGGEAKERGESRVDQNKKAMGFSQQVGTRKLSHHNPTRHPQGPVQQEKG